jgi:hypothetical protein
LLAACLVTPQPRPALAQMNMSGDAMGTKDEMPRDQLPVTQKLIGMCNAHIRITTTLEAQMWFEQGLNLIHDFWDYESARRSKRKDCVHDRKPKLARAARWQKNNCGVKG